ncbi:hypothetical protein H4R33_003022 [Dimargaris cristalligena]|nr:hypothetical protein H4R33_003022 [Dimargaris cristalligena]
MENIRNIQVPRYRRVKTPEDHVQYQVLVQAAVRSWHVWRRYSDFEALHGALQAQCPNLPAPPEQLPPKSWPQVSWDLGLGTLTTKVWTGLVNTSPAASPSRRSSPDPHHHDPLAGEPIDDKMRPKLDARREGLEKYLRAILHHSEPGWRASGPWGRFLEIPELRHGWSAAAGTTAATQGSPSSPGRGPTDSASIHSNRSSLYLSSTGGDYLSGDPLWTAQSWSDEFRQLAALNREVRNILLKRDLGSSRNEVAVVHQCTLRAKQLLADTGARGLALERGLRALANAKLISEGEERRRHDALVTWRDELNQLNLQVRSGTSSGAVDSPWGQRDSPSASTLHSRHPTQYSNGKSARDTRPYDSLAPREESYQQNAQRHDQLVNHGRTTSASTRSTRIFGNITSSSGGGIGGGSREARETEETKGLANSDLLTLQRDRMATQDGQLQQFSQILRRQNQLGTAIGDELDIQNQLLSEFSEDLDRTGTKLNNARKQLNRF